MKYATKTVLILAFIASLLSFTKFDHCYKSNWATPDVYTHACYSDIPALFGARDLVNHQWPYSSTTNAVEYPPLTGVVMWATSIITPHGVNSYKYYFLINVLLIIFLFLGVAWWISRMQPQFWYLLPLSPAVIAALYINWDLWAVITAIGAIYFFDRKFYERSAFLLGISIATKFFPIVFLIPISIIFYRRLELKKFLRYLLISVGTWIIVNLPFALTTPTGWWKFFKLNSERGADFGSLWYAVDLFGLHLKSINTFSLLLFLIGISAYAVYFFGLSELPKLSTTAFAAVAIFTISSKVYSPQYVLWLTPLAILAMREMKHRSAFWIWQAAEILYHLAIWQYLATLEGSHFGLPANTYAIAILVRISATIYFLVRVSTRSSAPQSLEFLISGSEGYA